MSRGLLDLALARAPGLKARERCLLSSVLDDEADFSGLSAAALGRLLGRWVDGDTWRPKALLEQAAHDALAAERSGIAWVCHGEGGYPPLLRELSDPPVALFYRGSLPDAEVPMVAVVGTREPTPEGARAAWELGRDLAGSGAQVVSGLARGIDAFAHRGALEAPGRTWAVLGSGLDRVYPASNRDLARRIVETGGALLGEYQPGEGPLKWRFPARNRIIAALARATVVVEAPEGSGALITADFALEQGRDLWVHEVALASRRGAGSRRLRADGAPVASGSLDVVGEWMLPRRELPGAMDDSAGCGAYTEASVPASDATGRALAARLARRLELDRDEESICRR